MLKKFTLGLLTGLFLMFLLVGSGWLAINWYAGQSVLSTTEADFTIEKGDSLGAIAHRLHSRGVIHHPAMFSVMGRLFGVAGSLHVGEYQITPDLSLRDVLNMFSQGQVRYYDVTLVEGLRFSDFIAELNQHAKLTQALTPETTQALLAQLGIEGSPEGLFYPDTYFFEAGATAKSVLVRAHKRLNEVLAEEWQKKSEGLPYSTPYQALILASIIEKETGATFERPDIAGVFVRRLQRKMRLQSDPTVIYGMGERYEGFLTRRFLKEKTPYNTYVISGLPPTPIAMIGREAIHAALNPKKGNKLYFVAKGDGTHYFSESLAEHNKAVRKYQIVERRADYRSTINAN